jgi:hypothetical protein
MEPALDLVVAGFYSGTITVRIVRPQLALDAAIGSHACSLEAIACMRPMVLFLISGGHSLTGWYL